MNACKSWKNNTKPVSKGENLLFSSILKFYQKKLKILTHI
jgi:hypothetical protein